ncbi:MAG: amidohydrolase family protein, partial [Roseovarius sp.]
MRSGTLSGRDPATGDGVCVTWRNGLLTASAPDPEAPDLWLAAGLVDLQINGFAGHDLNAEVLAPETVSAMARAVIATGTTRFLPTLITAPPARIAASLAVIAAARDADPLVARMIPGVHLEGPWISPEDGPRGAHPKAFVTAPDLELFDQWQAGCGGLVRIVTLSPHWPGSVAAIRGLVERGVQVSIGHTGADPAEIAGAAAAGATLC